MLSVMMVYAHVCQNTRGTPMLGVDQNAFSVLTVPETELVSGTSVLILVLVLVVKEHVVMYWTTFLYVAVPKVSLGTLSFCAGLYHVRNQCAILIVTNIMNKMLWLVLLLLITSIGNENKSFLIELLHTVLYRILCVCVCKFIILCYYFYSLNFVLFSSSSCSSGCYSTMQSITLWTKQSVPWNKWTSCMLMPDRVHWKSTNM